MNKAVGFVTYETAHAPCGGIAAVMTFLPRYFKNVTKLPTLVITPFHKQIAKTTDLKLKAVGTVTVPFEGENISVKVRKLGGAVAIYFLQSEDERFFAGAKHPYDVAKVGQSDTNVLLRDSLFFGAAVCKSLAVIAPETACTLMLQDWESATTALALAGKESHHTCYITMHNSYDSAASGEDLRRVGIAPGNCLGSTVLQRALKVSGHSVFTVSEQFARDLVDDPLQKTVMAPHLQNTLKPRLLGVSNGPFVKLGIDRKLLTAAGRSQFKPLQKWKSEQKKAALAALKLVTSTPETPVWGDPKQFRQDDKPWFVFAGRDDSRQKGYDVAVAAIRSFLKKRRDAKFLFFPIPGDEGLTGLNFLKKLTTNYPAQVIAFPFLWRAGFGAAICAAAYGVMPSLYEPFGMASEFYLQGTVGIARATGGLIQQINPVREITSCSSSVERLAAPWHKPQTPATGFLFRENIESETATAGDWRRINAASYLSTPGMDRIAERIELPLFKNMADELEKCLVDALTVYSDDPTAYFKMLSAGVRLIQQNFSWATAAQQYIAGLSDH